MRNSGGVFLLRLFVLTVLAVLGLTLFQGTWLAVVSYLLKNSQDTGLLVSSTEVNNFSLPTSEPPAAIGSQRTAGDVALTVTRVIRPADAKVAPGFYKSLDADQEFMLVGIHVACISPDKACHVTEFDFGVTGDSRQDYMAELGINFDRLNGLFQGGEISPGQSMDGDLVFIVARNDTGLVLSYPRLFAFNSSARFWLDR